jgi:hypothetical protein
METGGAQAVLPPARLGKMAACLPDRVDAIQRGCGRPKARAGPGYRVWIRPRSMACLPSPMPQAYGRRRRSSGGVRAGQDDTGKGRLTSAMV